MKVEERRFLLVDSKEVSLRECLYEKESYSFFGRSKNYDEKMNIDVDKIFEKYGIPEEFWKLLILVNLPSSYCPESSDFVSGHSFNLSAFNKMSKFVEKKNSDGMLKKLFDYLITIPDRCAQPKGRCDDLITGYSVIHDGKSDFALWFRTKSKYINYNDAMAFIKSLIDNNLFERYKGCLFEIYHTDYVRHDLEDRVMKLTLDKK